MRHVTPVNRTMPTLVRRSYNTIQVRALIELRGHARDPGHHCCTPPGRLGHHYCATLTPVLPLPPDTPPDPIPTLQYPTKRIAP